MVRRRCFWKNGQGEDASCDVYKDFPLGSKEREMIDDIFPKCGKKCKFWSPIPTLREIEKRRQTNK